MKTLLHSLLNLARRVIAKPSVDEWYRGRLKLMDNSMTNSCITQYLKENKPFMVARLGSVEIKPLLYFSVLNHLSCFKKSQLYIRGDIDYVFNPLEYENYMLELMCNNAGFFPYKREKLSDFASLMERDVKLIDICGCWLNEYLLTDFFDENVKFSSLGNLEPYDYECPWTVALKGKKVLVIHPFAKSIEEQYSRRELIWENPDILPEFNLKTIKAVQSIAGEPTPFQDWFEALDYMKNQMDAIDYDVAIIGCGAYGLPLAAHVKRQGKMSIHLGGPVQILFGIKGKRWDSIPTVSKFYNDYWIRPSESEKPNGSFRVENGCYW